MPSPNNEAQIARLEEQLKSVREDVSEARAAIAALQAERNKALLWGVMTLGTAVVGMAYWIFNNLIGGHIK